MEWKKRQSEANGVNGKIESPNAQKCVEYYHYDEIRPDRERDERADEHDDNDRNRHTSANGHAAWDWHRVAQPITLEK